jgi:NAD(P)H-hydrate epimerase
MSEVLTTVFDRENARALLPKVSSADNKATRGRSLLIAGSKSYPGAGVLAARAALRSGSGYAVLAQDAPPFLALENPDFLVVDLQTTRLRDLAFDAVAIGPGCGADEATAIRIRELNDLGCERTVLDADALTVLSAEPLLKVRASWILTPHEGELSRLMGVSADAIRLERSKWVLASQKKYGCVVLLKGHRTLIAHSRADTVELREVRAGNSALAKSGTGDVLTGVITAFLAQGLVPVDAAALGAFVHGEAADLWVAKGRDPLSMLASDLIELLPEALARLRLS